MVRVERDFNVTWPNLLEAKSWIISKLGSTFSEPLHYCIESTGTYHMPILRAFGGQPSVVNPLLAGPTRRKTDRLDARLLAHHSITGLWPKSFLPGEAGLKLRVLWAARGEAMRAATRASNRVNNIILRFGHTVASEDAVRSTNGRAIIGALTDGEVPNVPTVAPTGLPQEIRPVIKELMEDLDCALVRARRAEAAAVAFIQNEVWPAGTGELPGGALLDL